MKKHLGILIASVVIGFLGFCILHWIFQFSYEDSILLGLTLGLTGFIVEMLRPSIVRLCRPGKLE